MDQHTFTVVARIAYDGTSFAGFQLQNTVPTIQGELETALAKITGHECRVVAAGRTDSGVHARGQVISAEVQWTHGTTDLQRALNANLPSSIAIQQMARAPAGFHPRFSATNRTYRYFVHWVPKRIGETGPAYSPLSNRFALFEHGMLDIEAMQSAAQILIGQHDFGTFGQPPQGTNTNRIVTRSEWQIIKSNLELFHEEGQYLVFTITANAFLHRMVRNIVGSLLEVGRRRWTIAQLQRGLKASNRALSAPPVPPHGLVLEKVDYAEHSHLFS